MGVEGDPSEAHIGQSQTQMKALLPLQKDVIIREAGISEDDLIRSCEKPNYCSKA